MAEDKPTGSEQDRPSRTRVWFRRGLIALGVVGVTGAVLLAGMEYYTGRSDFCGSCHIMVPYYDSWHKDVHSKDAVAGCIDCHYEPGERHTIKAKLRGLSQLVSYVAGRTGDGRPRPRVQDASCMQSGCHSTEEIAEVPCLIRDVRFVHSKHLNPDPNQLTENAEKLAGLSEALGGALDEESFKAVRDLALNVGDPDMNRRRMESFVGGQLGRPELSKQAVEYAEALHHDIRLKQVRNLRCTTCHAHNEDAKHFSVRQQVCYLCHFINQPFNMATSRCLGCHEPPAIAIPVHGAGIKGGTTTTAASLPTSKPVKVIPGTPTIHAGTMDHAVIIANNVNCISCHADLIEGTGEVTRQRCAGCHDLARYFEGFEKDLNAETVASLHKAHTSNLHASCVECHGEIDHRLLSEERLVQRGGFYRSVLDHCGHCHPNHHRRQVELLTGRAERPIPTGSPNAMFGSRTNCLGCHTGKAEDTKGSTVIEATKQACLICHAEDYAELFDQWMSRMEAGIKDAKFLEDRARKLLAKSGPERGEARRAAQEAIDKGHAAAAFVSMGKGIHNRNYALELLQYASDQFEKAAELLGEAPTSRAVEAKP
ncbi:MAG: NapC/NirT family cytochrome c [Phycisphaerae bacterium]|nr:NapC/NirT family cytochrome c [Phycisphaerae bacterium]